MPLGFRLLLHRKQRLLTAIAGIVMAVTIMFVQAGLLSGVMDAQSQIANLMRADFIAMNSLRTNLHNWTRFPAVRLDEIAADPDVNRVTPIYERTAGIRIAAPPGRRRDPSERPIRTIIVFAFPPDDAPLAIGNPGAIEAGLRRPGSMLFDHDSRPIYGVVKEDGKEEMDGRNWRIGGFVNVGPDIVYDGSVVIGSAAQRSEDPNERPIMGAVHLNPGVDRDAARARILALLPGDISLLTPDEVRMREIAFTLHSAPIGIVFGIGMLAGLFVGAVTCYQVLFNEIADHVKMYTMIKAMGFSEGFLRRIIVGQAVLLAILGFAVGAVLASLIARYVAAESGFDIDLAPQYVGVVFLGTVVVCIAAGLLALRRVEINDPAELF